MCAKVGKLSYLAMFWGEKFSTIFQIGKLWELLKNARCRYLGVYIIDLENF